MTTKDYQDIAPTLPKQPGVYRFIDKEGTILYVGKAKHLKKRLASYFGDKKHRTNKTRTMVRNAHHIEYTIVETETDGNKITALYNLLQRHRAMSKAKDETEKSTVVLQADKAFSFAVLNKIMQTAAMAGYPNFRFAIQKE